MKSWFTLVLVNKVVGHLNREREISGTWLQNHFGTLASATCRAISTEKVNRNSNIAVIEGCLDRRIGDAIINMKRLDRFNT